MPEWYEEAPLAGDTDWYKAAPLAESLTAGERVGQYASGFNEGLAQALGMPVDLVNAGMRYAGANVSETPFMGSKSLLDVLNRAGSIAPEREEARFGRRVSKEVGAAAPFAAIPAAAALRPAAAVTAATPVTARVGQAIVEPFRRTPALAVGTEALAATGGGIGAATAREIAPGDRLAETAGQIGGALSPAALGLLPVSLARRTISRFGPEAQARRTGEVLRKTLGKEITEDVAAEARASLGAAREIEGFQPSLAETTGKQSLVTTQRVHEARLSGERLETAIRRHDDNIQAIDAFAAERAPKSDVDIDLVIDAAGMKVDRLQSALDDATKGVVERRRDVGQTPYANRQSAGASIREALIERRTEASAEMSRVADDIGLNDLDFAPQFDALRDDLVETMTPAGRFADESKTPDIIKVLEADKGSNLPVTFDDLKSLRESISDEMRSSLAGMNVDKGRARLLRLGLGKLDKYIEKLPIPEDAGIDYPKFRDTYYNEFIKKFDQGVMSKVRRKDGSGYYATADEDVVKSFWGPGKETELDQFNAVFGDDLEMTGILKDVAVDDMMAAVTRDGVIKQTLLDNWVKKHRNVFDKVPEIRELALSRQSTNDALVVRAAVLDGRQRKIADAMLTRRLQSYARGEKPAEQIISEAVSKPRLMRQLVNSVGKDKTVQEALRRHVWDGLVSNDATAMQAAIKQNREGLTIALGEKHMQNLDTIMKARTMVERVPSPEGAAIAATPLEGVEAQIGMGLPQAASRIYAVESGRIGWRYVATEAFSRAFRNRSIRESERLLDQALYDPEIAEALAVMTVREPTRAMANKFNRRLLASGLRAYALEED